jgi:hypothetical protein
MFAKTFADISGTSSKQRILLKIKVSSAKNGAISPANKS